MLEECRDLRAEADALHGFLVTLPEPAWSRPTQFQGWTPWDVVAHLHLYDRVSLAAAEGRESFERERDALLRQMKTGRSNAEIARAEFGALSPDALLARWHADGRELAERLGALDPKARLPWFGPDMGVRMFTTARLMETWAHGQEVYDLLGATREPSDRLRHIATLGVRTYGWTFANRGLEPPGPAPRVSLEAPSGGAWEWNEESASGRVSGPALEFCQVVTQVRNVADTSLEVSGEAATRWMAIAQCFAGPPTDPPKPGSRGPRD